MEKIWELYEELNEFVHVADMEDHHLVYMNRKLREANGIAPGEDYSARKCYEVIQNCQEPCASCDNCKLRPGYFKESQQYSPQRDKHFLIKTTMLEDEGRKYRLEIAIDVTAQERRGEALRDYQSLERYVYEGVRVAMKETRPDESIAVVLEYLGAALRGDRTYVFEKKEDGCDYNTYEWVANGVTPEKENLQGLPPEVCARWYQDFVGDKNIIIDDLEDIREEDPLQYENLKRQRIHSLVVVPLGDEGRTIGFYGVDNPPKGSLDYAEDLLQIMGYFIVHFIHRRNLYNRMSFMSTHDQLTGLENRYAMEECIHRIADDEQCGVVYCDVTGLKQVNDTQGHTAGDALLLRAAKSIRNTFGGQGLFRIGGDEFLILCRHIGRSDMEERGARLKEEALKDQVNLAIGMAWRQGTDCDMETLFSRAEELMYSDKAEYYRKMGIDRRRNR